MPLTKTRSLIADLALVLELPGLPPDDAGGYRLSIGDDTTVLIYGQNDETLLVVAPLGPLPAEVGYGVTLYLLRMNMFNADIAPFRVAVDDGGGLILWASVPVEALTGDALAGLLGALAERVEEIRREVFEEDDEDEDEEDAVEEGAGAG